jgi:hypothetical protein
MQYIMSFLQPKRVTLTSAFFTAIKNKIKYLHNQIQPLRHNYPIDDLDNLSQTWL